ncbi:MAG: DMT family transporter [Chloroflexi bacterium]|nr:DMT family transporter [Chloroflexota bacterium]MCA2001411.1 DMT family transporter [Chloroflexota bacterium]
MTSQKALLGHLAALFTVFVWGVTFISTKVLLVSFSPIEIMFYRLILALFALTMVSPPRLTFFLPDLSALRGEWKAMAAGLCGVTLFFLLQNAALSYTLAANVSVLLSVIPLCTALVSRVVLKEKLKAGFFFGFAVSITGVILIAFNGSFILKLNPLGDLLTLLAALVWALYSILIKGMSADEGGTLAVTRKVFFYGLLFMLPALPLFGFRFGFERLTVLPNILNLFFLGVGGSALCFFTWNFAVHRLGPVKTSAYLYLVPMVTIAASALVLHEKITPLAGVGVALILGGMAFSEWGNVFSKNRR